MHIEQPHDPYKEYKFRIKWNGRYVAGLSKMSALKRTTQPVSHRQGREPNARSSSALAKHEPITMERGVTHDPEFATWASAAQSSRHVSLKNTRRELAIDVFDEAGDRVQSYKVHAAWVSELKAQPVIQAGAKAVAIDSIIIQHEGWERD